MRKADVLCFSQKNSEKFLLKLLDHDRLDHDTNRESLICPPPLAPWTHFSKNRLVSRQASNPQSGHADRMSCNLSEVLERTRPPDAELVDLIELAFLEGQIDGIKADLAYSWLLAKNKDLCAVARI